MSFLGISISQLFTIRILCCRFLDNIDIFVNNDDCIPRMSLASIAKLVKMVRAVDSLNLTAREHLQLIFQPDATPESTENYNRIKDAITNITQDTFGYLEHPGKIHYIKRIETDDVVTFSLSQQRSERLSQDVFLQDRMVYDHLSQYYDEALSNCMVK